YHGLVPLADGRFELIARGAEPRPAVQVRHELQVGEALHLGHADRHTERPPLPNSAETRWHSTTACGPRRTVRPRSERRSAGRGYRVSGGRRRGSAAEPKTRATPEATMSIPPRGGTAIRPTHRGQAASRRSVYQRPQFYSCTA